MMSDLPPDVSSSSSSSFEIQPRLQVEMEYFKENALQETERWIEAVTKKRFKYPYDPRRSLQDGVLLCELVNALKPGSVRRINRLPTPIAFLDNLTVFQNACRYEFGLQEVQLFDIKDLEDLSLRGVLESEEEIHYETARRLKNVAITVFWLGKSVRRWFKGPILDFSAFTDIIDMSQSSQASFRTPSEASFVSSGRFSTDRSYLPPGRQSDLSYERVANYLGSSKSCYGYQENLGNQESLKRPGSYKTGLEFDECSLEDGVDSASIDHPVKSGNTTIASSANTSAVVDVRDYHSQQQRHSNTAQNAKVHSSDFGQVLEPSKEQQSPASSSGTAKSLDSLQFVRSGSNSLAEDAKQTMELLKQKSTKPISTNPEEDDDWAAKLVDWKLRRRSQTKSLRLSDSEEVAETVREDGSRFRKDTEVASPHSTSTDLVESSLLPEKTVFKKREQEEGMLALFGFTKVGGKPTVPKVGDKPAVKPKSFAKFGKADMTDNSHHIDNEKVAVRLSQVDEILPIASNQQQQQSPREVEEFSRSVLPRPLPSDEFESSFRRNETEVTTALAVCGTGQQKFTEKIIKISQRPKHHKGFGFTIKGGKEYGEPIRVDKVHLGGAADVCDLMSKDEIVAINGAQLANHYLESVRSVIDQAVHCGTVELTIRRQIKEKSCEEFENEVFSEEELQFNNSSFEDNSEAQQGLEFPRPLTPLPLDDEPPPLPSVPPPPPNWNTFPGPPEAFSPSDVVQYLDEDVDSYAQRQDLALSKQAPSSGSNNDFSQTRGQEWSPVEPSNLSELDPEERSVTSESSESDKHEILMKRIHFFGLKPEESEEYRKLTEETNMKSVKSDKLAISSLASTPAKPLPVHFEERAFAVVVRPATKPPSATASSLQEPQQPSSPMNGNRSILHDSEQKNEDDIVLTKETVHNEATIFNPFNADIEKRELLLFESKRPDAQIDASCKFAVNNFERRDTAGQIETTKQTFTASSPKQHIKSQNETKPVGQFDLSSKASENGHHKVDSKEDYTISESRDKPTATERILKREFSQPFERSKGWKSMELLRSHSVPDRVRTDPMEKARADYLSLMMARPKPNLETINRQYFDLDGDLKRMEEWNMKQEQLRKEKFERDKEELRRKHEAALQEANALEQEKQKQEEQMLKKEITWKKQLEEIQVEREIELAKRQKEEGIRMKLAQEKAERELKEKMKKLMVEKEKEEQQRKLMADNAEDERGSNEFISSTKQFQNQFEYSGGNVTKSSPPCAMLKEPDDSLTARVEAAFIGSGPTHATLEALSDSVSASSESLCSSVQQEFSVVAEGKVVGCAAKAVEERDESSVVNRAGGSVSVVQNTCNFEADRAAESKVIKEKLAVGDDDDDDHLRNSSPSGIQSKGDGDGSARDEALLVSRRPGGKSHWNFSEPDSFSQPVKQPVHRVVPHISTPSISSATSGQQQQQQFLQEQQQQMQRQQQQQHHQQEQPPWNRRLLQDICAPPKHRLQDSESWILPCQDEDREEFGEVIWQEQEVRQTQPVSDSRPSKPKPAVPRRTDSLKQSDTSTSVSSEKPAAPAAHVLPSSLLRDPQRHQTFETFHDPSVGKRQSSGGASTEMLWKHLESAANAPDSVTSATTRRGDTPAARVQELSLTSKYYYAKPQPPKSRPPYSSVETTTPQHGGFSSQIPARAAIPVHRDLRDPVPREPTSEAVSMLFDYHRNPQKNENRSSGKAPLGSEGGQKCAGCDKELGFGRCIVIDSLDFCIHPECFQCSVCRAPLRSGAAQLTNEFQILGSKLHCRNCYTNEQEGLKYSKV